jgi:hypothetical protein
MPTSLLKGIVFSSLIAVASAGYAHAQDLVSAKIIGAPVSDPRGTEIGEVADVSFDDNGRPDRLRVRISPPLGFGQRTAEISRGTYMLLRGRVLLELSADDLRALPDVGDEIDEKRSE